MFNCTEMTKSGLGNASSAQIEMIKNLGPAGSGNCNDGEIDFFIC